MGNEVFMKAAQLVMRKKRLKADLDRCEDELKNLQSMMVEAFAQGGMDKVTYQGVTFYPQTKYSYRAVNGSEVLYDALANTGLREFVKTEPQYMRLLAHLKEVGLEGLPESVRKEIEFNETIEIRTRAS